MLFIPVLHIDNRDKSIEENRMLAVYKPLFKNGKINYSYGKDFEKWFNDRFNLRKKITHTYNFLIYKIQANRFEKNKVTLMKKNGYILQDNKWIYQNITNNKLKKIAVNLNTFNEYCKGHNIKLYILIPPVTYIYNAKYDIVHTKNRQDYMPRLLKIAKDEYNLDLIYPEKYLRENENGNNVYYKIKQAKICILITYLYFTY